MLKQVQHDDKVVSLSHCSIAEINSLPVGSTLLAYLATILPSLSIKNFSKFHLISALLVTSLSVRIEYKGDLLLPLTSI